MGPHFGGLQDNTPDPAYRYRFQGFRGGEMCWFTVTAGRETGEYISKGEMRRGSGVRMCVIHIAIHPYDV